MQIQCVAISMINFHTVKFAWGCCIEGCIIAIYGLIFLVKPYSGNASYHNNCL